MVDLELVKIAVDDNDQVGVDVCTVHISVNHNKVSVLIICMYVCMYVCTVCICLRPYMCVCMNNTFVQNNI